MYTFGTVSVYVHSFAETGKQYLKVEKCGMTVLSPNTKRNLRQLRGPDVRKTYMYLLSE